jgi:hypothetical protein
MADVLYGLMYDDLADAACSGVERMLWKTPELALGYANQVAKEAMEGFGEDSSEYSIDSNDHQVWIMRDDTGGIFERWTLETFKVQED